MNENLSLGRIAGIHVGLNWSLLVIGALIAGSLATGIFPAAVPGQTSGTYWTADWANPYLPFQKIPPSALIANSILVYNGSVDISQVSALTHESAAVQFAHANLFDRALSEADSATAIAPNRALAHAVRSSILRSCRRSCGSCSEW